MPSPESEIEVSSPLDTQTGLPTAAKGEDRGAGGATDGTLPDDQGAGSPESDAGLAAGDDDAALHAVKRWSFVPAKQGDVAQVGWVSVPIDFKIH